MAAPAKKLKGDLSAENCPSREVLDHVTSRWGTLVLVRLFEQGTLRFGEVRRAVGGVSEKMLAQTLQVLESDGFVDRKAWPEIPPRVEYSLTPMGAELAKHLQTLGGWIESNLGRVMAARANRKSPSPRPSPR
jgi:DNA-binding HxlR family transcriptional regulator